MLQYDPVGKDSAFMTLYRNPRTVKEVINLESSRALRAALTLAVYPELTTGTHSPLVGEETAISNTRNGKTMLAAFAGSWRSNARRLSLYASESKLDEVSMEMARTQEKKLLNTEDRMEEKDLNREATRLEKNELI